jgi:hypothetical protein
MNTEYKIHKAKATPFVVLTAVLQVDLVSARVRARAIVPYLVATDMDFILNV